MKALLVATAVALIATTAALAAPVPAAYVYAAKNGDTMTVYIGAPYYGTALLTASNRTTRTPCSTIALGDAAVQIDCAGRASEIVTDGPSGFVYGGHFFAAVLAK